MHSRDSLEHVRTIGGGKGDGPAQLNQPAAVCCDESHVYVADCDNHKVKVYDKSSLEHVRTLGGAKGDGPEKAHAFISMFIHAHENHDAHAHS